MFRTKSSVVAKILVIAAFIVVSSLRSGYVYAAGNPSGAAYTLTNVDGANHVVAWNRGPDGALTPAADYPTGGKGTGSGLGSQGALVLDKHHHLLFAVNAGSDSITTFAVVDGGLKYVDTVWSGGAVPVSLTTSGNILYVVNAGYFPASGMNSIPGNITGFLIGRGGRLYRLAGSKQPLSQSDHAVGPAEVAFSPHGSFLVVTEKATNMLDTYVVDRHGRAGPPKTTPSNGTTPFGFAFTKGGQVLVSEAMQGAASSYAISRQGELTPISASVPTTQGAPCWLIVSADGRYAYTANAADTANSISGFSVTPDGHLALLNPGVTPANGTHPTDMAQSADGHFLYVLSNVSGNISGFSVNDDGSLTALPAATMTGLPASAVGLAAW